MVVGPLSTLPAANQESDRLLGEQREGLSGKAGLPSITPPIETTGQSLVLRRQIRPPDAAALLPDSPLDNERTSQRQYMTNIPSSVCTCCSFMQLRLRVCRQQTVPSTCSGIRFKSNNFVQLEDTNL